MSHKARPCPWCGAEQDMTEGDYNDRTGNQNVRCGDCGLGGPYRKTEDAALKAWNTRPGEDLLRAACVAYLDLLDDPDDVDTTRVLNVAKMMKFAIAKATGGVRP